MSLSDKRIIVGGEEVPVYPEKDVKEFIEKIKKRLVKKQEKFCQEKKGDIYWFDSEKMFEEIDKEAGEKLT